MNICKYCRKHFCLAGRVVWADADANVCRERGGQKRSRLSNVAEKLAALRAAQKNFGNPLRPSHCDVHLCWSQKSSTYCTSGAGMGCVWKYLAGSRPQRNTFSRDQKRQELKSTMQFECFQQFQTFPILIGPLEPRLRIGHKSQILKYKTGLSRSNFWLAIRLYPCRGLTPLASVQCLCPPARTRGPAGGEGGAKE